MILKVMGAIAGLELAWEAGYH
ncbi:hypothetical protein LINPERHAP1_LOCUS30754 [Linum perenne]